jgi:hypothetical protein
MRRFGHGVTEVVHDSSHCFADADEDEDEGDSVNRDHACRGDICGGWPGTVEK